MPRRLLLTGRVQGVGLRYMIYKKASAESVAGFVKNLPDGRIMLEIQGTEDQLNKLTRWLKGCPGWSKIIDLTSAHIEPGDDKIFVIYD